MTANITAHTILNGARNLIVQYNIVSDGSGDLTDFPLLNVLDYTGTDQRQPNNFKVMSVSGRNGRGTTFQLKFGDTGNDHRLFFESVPEREFKQTWVAGLSTLLANTDMTIRMSTTGFEQITPTIGDTISVVIRIKKKIQNTSS